MLSDKDTASLIEEIFDDLMIDDVRVIAGGSFPTNTVIFLSQNKNVQVIASIESYTFDIGTTNGGYTKEKFKIELNINNFCYSIYFTCYYNNKPFKISNISLNIDNYEIKSNSSKIIINNFDNIHLIEFFPTNNYDFIKKNNIYGININNINIKINPELPINLQDCDFFISIGIINYRILKINPQ
jgi:hypothetical protein